MVQIIRQRRTTPAAQTQITTPLETDTKQLIDFIGSALTGTGQEEFYNTKEEQRKALFQAHKPILEKYREFYALLLVSTINDINKQIIIFNLLKHGRVIDKEQKAYEDKVIAQALTGMQTSRAYKALGMLAENKVNNKRTRAFVKKWLEGRENYKYEFLKYKATVKKIVTHSHLYKKNEIWDFLFDKKKDGFKDNLLNLYNQAKTDKEAVFKLPFSIAEGFAAYHKIDRADFLKKIKGKMTDTEKQRLTTSAKKVGVDVEADWTQGDLRKILIYLYSIDRTPPEIKEIIDKKAKEEAIGIPYKYEHVVAVVDNSASAYGSEEKKYHPIASALAITYVLEKLSRDFTIIYTNPDYMGNRFIPGIGGQTNLAVPLVRALQEKPDAVFLITDGYENVVSGAVAQVINAFKRQLDKDNKTIIVQLSPVFAAEAQTVRQLSELVPSVGIRDQKQLFGALLLATMQARKETTLAQFVEYLKGRVKDLEYKTYLLEE